MSERDDQARAVLRVPFALTRTVRDPRGAVRRLRAVEADGRRAWTFDLRINTHATKDGSTLSNNYSAAVVELGARIDGRIGLARRGPLRRAEKLGAAEVPAGTPELQRRFEVRSAPPALADEVLTPSVCSWLAGPGRGFHYEIVHDRVLAYGWRRYISSAGPLKAARGLARALAEAAGGGSGPR